MQVTMMLGGGKKFKNLDKICVWFFCQSGYKIFFLFQSLSNLLFEQSDKY